VPIFFDCNILKPCLPHMVVWGTLRNKKFGSYEDEIENRKISPVSTDCRMGHLIIGSSINLK